MRPLHPAPLLPSLPPLLLLLLLLLLRPSPVRAAPADSPVSGDYNCADHVPTPPPIAQPGCLSRLRDNPSDYDRCKSATCYIFLQEPPFVSLDPDVFDDTAAAVSNQRPFRCANHSKAFPSLAGIAFELHKETSSGQDAWCMWGGHARYCTFNALVDYTQVMAEQGYQFAVTGLLLETPARQCHHEASAPFVDNSMIIIGRRTKDQQSTGALTQLTRPFAWATWAIFAGVLLLFILVCIAIAVRFHVFRGRSLITAFFIFTGERNEALAHETHVRGASGDPTAQQAMSFATKYGLSMTLYRLALLAFIGIFALFYEVAVVNFLFTQQTVSLSKSVKSLSAKELSEYAVLKNSALENVWAATVSKPGLIYGSGDDDNIPWQQCDTATECIQWAAGQKAPKNPDVPVKFVVTFEIVGKYLLNTNSDCENLTIFETKDLLYQFNAGWLYNNRVDEETRKQVDRELVGLRINGKIRSFIEEEIGDFSCTNTVKPDIGPMIILVPCLIFVIPPLLMSIVVLLFWKWGRPRDRHGPTMNEMVRRESSPSNSASASASASMLDMDSTDPKLSFSA